MAVKRFLFLTQAQAGGVNGMTQLGHALEPTLIRGGPYVGNYVLNLLSRSDPKHAQHAMFLNTLPEVNLEMDEAFPEVPME